MQLTLRVLTKLSIGLLLFLKRNSPYSTFVLVIFACAVFVGMSNDLKLTRHISCEHI